MYENSISWFLKDMPSFEEYFRITQNIVMTGVGLAIYLAPFIILISFFICRKIVRKKSLESQYTWLSVLGLVGIIVLLFVPSKNVACKKCGKAYNPTLGLKCPACGEEMEKVTK